MYVCKDRKGKTHAQESLAWQAFHILLHSVCTVQESSQ